MSGELFSTALRAEIEAVVARYEALAKAHHQALMAAAHEETLRLQERLGLQQKEHEQVRAELENKTARVALLEAEIQQFEQDLALANEALEKERRQALLASEQFKAELSQAKEQSAAFASRLQALSEDTQQLQGAFAQEKAFVAACSELASTPLLDALEQALGQPISPSALVYNALKCRRLDVVLTQAMKDRGRQVLASPLLEAEKKALSPLALAAACELIEPGLGTRFSSESMDKSATSTDPAEEGNVLECLMPGLRLAQTQGALIFPRVRVAVG